VNPALRTARPNESAFAGTPKKANRRGSTASGRCKSNGTTANASTEARAAAWVILRNVLGMVGVGLLGWNGQRGLKSGSPVMDEARARLRIRRMVTA